MVTFWLVMILLSAFHRLWYQSKSWNEAQQQHLQLSILWQTAQTPLRKRTLCQSLQLYQHTDNEGRWQCCQLDYKSIIFSLHWSPVPFLPRPFNFHLLLNFYNLRHLKIQYLGIQFCGWHGILHVVNICFLTWPQRCCSIQELSYALSLFPYDKQCFHNPTQLIMWIEFPT